ncbi:MAG: rhomboid family intramembrane serine protease [bacterium]
MIPLKDRNPTRRIPFVSSLFLHGGWLHLGGNMLYLWIFGDNVEDKLGHGRFIVFYLLTGFSASVLHIVIDPGSAIPTIGASGAISGVLGAYLLLFPGVRVLTVIPIFIFLQFVELPALVILGFWFVMQFFNGILSLGFETSGMGGVAWWAHIGGFAAGLILVMPFRKYQ